MSASKFVMAQKLQNVQSSLMGMELDFLDFPRLLSIIFEECRKENLTFWFNFIDDTCILNLRDTQHENYELNIRYLYEGMTLFDDGNVLDKIKLYVLQNTFLLTENSVEGFQEKKVAASSESIDILAGDKPVPKHISKAIETIQAKGIPVTIEAIRNHLPLNEMSTSSRIECNRYLKEHMEAS